MKRILGLDLGPNSIGWAVINCTEENSKDAKLIGIEAAGSRIIPMDAAVLGKFENGTSVSQTSERTQYRGVRRIRERNLLRRERLNRVLNIMGFLPEHYAEKLSRYGKISDYKLKLAWVPKENNKQHFLFEASFNEMLNDFAANQPGLVSEGKLIPYDWTIYYLRKKALTQEITSQELAWILLNFNQKRGYYQLRGEDEDEKANELVEYYNLEVTDVRDTGEKRGKDVWYEVQLANGWIYKRSSSIPLDWVGKSKEFIVTTQLNPDGTPKLDKDGQVKRSFRAPKEEDWTLRKKKTEADIERSNETVGAYIYDNLLKNPSQKIRGQLVRTIERKFYKDELKQILRSQEQFHAELRDRDLLDKCIEELYPNNEMHRDMLEGSDFVRLFVDDIIFYQRPLKSKKSLIADCPYEERDYVDKETGEIKHAPIKCIAKSNPLFQEFRLWQFISNLRIYQKERKVASDDGMSNLFSGNEKISKIETDVDVTREFLKTPEDYTDLFDWLNGLKAIDQKAFLKYPAFGLKKKIDNYRWNYVEDKSYPCNETRASMLSRFSKIGLQSDFLSKEIEYNLWEIFYSVEDKKAFDTALHSFAKKHNLDERFVEAFSKMPPYKKEYGSYSAKAIKKLLPLMRMGKYWNVDAIDKNTLERINAFIGAGDSSLKERLEKDEIKLSGISSFSGLPVWLCCYIVYGRHSEAKDILKWNKPEDIDAYLMEFKQHSLRNPIVEQVITETLRTVRDIWKKVGNIDEIHLELGRDLKNPADKRLKMTQKVIQNENTNLRIKAMLMEFMNPEFCVENVRPYSPSQQDLLRIYEDGVLNSIGEIPPTIEEILKKFNENDAKKRPTTSEVLKYKLWLEQKYRSPYTGQCIPLGKLFTPAYEIEHVIPQSRYFDDSFSNKVICEAEVNKKKDRELGYEFIQNHHGEKVKLGFGKEVEIFGVEDYEQFVKKNYSGNPSKLRHLLMDEIPDAFIQRQLNDSRYIAKYVQALLSNIVRENLGGGEYEPEATSKNLISCNGSITDRLKKDWGINDIWNEIILPRFVRLNKLTDSQQFTAYSENAQKDIPAMPLELQKGFNKKRIDHRHHAMDAIVIACATRNIINYLNNESACKDAKIKRQDLQNLLCEKVRINGVETNKKVIKKPWDTFTQDVREALLNIVVSFKQNLRVINKTGNRYLHYENGKKVPTVQTTGTNWAIRKPLHKETVYGRVNLRSIKEVRLSIALQSPQRIVEKDLKKKIIELLNEGNDEKAITRYFNENKELWSDIQLSKIKVYVFSDETNTPMAATRFCNDLVSLFKGISKKDAALSVIEKITDTGIQKILRNYLEYKKDDPAIAFSPDGIDELNSKIEDMNGGKRHMPIFKVRVVETLGNKFPIGNKDNKSSKYVEAAKGTNIFFGVYQSFTTDKETGEQKLVRNYSTVPLNVAIEREKQGLNPVPEVNELGDKLLFYLSPNDLVYVPTEDEIENGIMGHELDKRRIYKLVSSTEKEAFFISAQIASPIINKYEFSPLNKMARALTGEMVKEICIPIKIDRLGNICLKEIRNE